MGCRHIYTPWLKLDKTMKYIHTYQIALKVRMHMRVGIVKENQEGQQANPGSFGGIAIRTFAASGFCVLESTTSI